MTRMKSPGVRPGLLVAALLAFLLGPRLVALYGEDIGKLGELIGRMR